MSLLTPKVEAYLQGLEPFPSALEKAVKNWSDSLEIRPLDRGVASWLRLVGRTSGLEKILGLGSRMEALLHLAEGSEGSHVFAVDPSPERLDEGLSLFRSLEREDRYHPAAGEFRALLAQLPAGFDGVWVEADPQTYRILLDALLPKVRVGGMLFFYGVLHPEDCDPDFESEASEHRRRFNSYVGAHPQALFRVLPLGQGLSVGVKTRETRMEHGGPFLG